MPYIGTGRISLFFEEAGNGGIPLLLLHELAAVAKVGARSSRSWRRIVVCSRWICAALGGRRSRPVLSL